MPDISNPPGISDSADVDHDQTSGGTAGNPHSASAGVNHGNEAHSTQFATVSGGVIV